MPADPLVHLVGGAQGIVSAWESRSSPPTRRRPGGASPTFAESLLRAELDLRTAAHLAPDDPLPWTHLLVAGRGLRIAKADLVERWNQATRRCDALYFAHEQLLQGLCLKWGGSHEAMFAFARELAARGDNASPLGALVAIAHLELYVATDVGTKRQYFSGSVRDELHHMAAAVHRPGYPWDSAGVAAANCCAVLLFLCECHDEAVAVMATLGPRLREFPWQYLNRPATVATSLLRLAGHPVA